MDKISRLKEFLQASPTDNFVQHALALEYIKIGEDGEARKLFENILSHDENYVGSYYHLGKLLERTGLPQEALACYQKGMERAKATNERHAYSELQSAYEDLSE